MFVVMYVVMPSIKLDGAAERSTQRSRSRLVGGRSGSPGASVSSVFFVCFVVKRTTEDPSVRTPSAMYPPVHNVLCPPSANRGSMRVGYASRASMLPMLLALYKK